jgi:hypothetical protein
LNTTAFNDLQQCQTANESYLASSNPITLLRRSGMVRKIATHCFSTMRTRKILSVTSLRRNDKWSADGTRSEVVNAHLTSANAKEWAQMIVANTNERRVR